MSYLDITYPIPKHVRKWFKICIEQKLFYGDLLHDASQLDLKGMMSANCLCSYVNRFIDTCYIYDRTALGEKYIKQNDLLKELFCLKTFDKLAFESLPYFCNKALLKRTIYEKIIFSFYKN